MNKFSVAALEALAVKIMNAAGVPMEEAYVVVEHCIHANLAGHDSHGIMRIPEYVRRVRAGQFVPGAAFSVVQETSTTAIVDGGGGFGQVVMRRAMELAISKAQAFHVAAIAVRNQGHTGRLAFHAIQAAERGLIAFVFGNSGRGAPMVAPYGGARPKLHTNPMAIAIPTRGQGTLHIDMATSAVSWGKIKLAAEAGLHLPPGKIVDSAGRTSINPADFLNGGAILPFGGNDAFKGYGLSVMIQVFCSILSGIGYGEDPPGLPARDSCFVVLVDIEAFRPLGAFEDELAAFIASLKATPPASGFSEVLYPGERSAREREIRKHGLIIDKTTMIALREAADHLNVEWPDSIIT